MSLRRALAALLALSIMVGSPGYSAVSAQTSPPAAGPELDEVTPPRVSYLHGEVSFWRPGAEDWGRAALNTPLAPGDTLFAAQGGNVEIQVGPRAFVRAGDGTQLGLDNQDPDFVQLRVTEGHVAVDVRDLPGGERIEIGTPSGAFVIERAGFYRLDVTQDSAAFRAYRGGAATVIPAGGAEVGIESDRQVVLVGTESPRVVEGPAAELAAWDRWNYERTDALLSVATSRYVPSDVYGAEMLAQHGSWRTVETYGNVWVPARVAPGWSPYSTGRWIWDPRYGWTWIDDAPWGWAPYHYGRWVHVGSYWAWAPGPMVVRTVYSPALVVFLGGGVSLSFGWAPLGWGEPVIPWWGRPGFVGRPWWGGWGGPRVVNNVVVNRNTTVNVTNINVYRNVHVTNAVVAVPRDRFGRGGERPTRVVRADVQRLSPVHGALPVRPVAASLTPATGRAAKPPEQVRTRPVVVTRPPRDMTPVLRSEGLAADRAPVPAARVVPSSRGAERRERPAAPASPGTEPARGDERRDDRAERDADRRGRPTPPVAAPAQDGAPRVAPQPEGVRPEAPRPEPARPARPQSEPRQSERQPDRPERDAERRGRQTPPPPSGQDGAQRAAPPAGPTAPRAVPPAPTPSRPESPREDRQSEPRQSERQTERAERDAERRGRQTPLPPGSDSAPRATPPAAPPAPRATPPAAPAAPRAMPPTAPAAPRATPPAAPPAPRAVTPPAQPERARPEPPRPEPRAEERRREDRSERDAAPRARPATPPAPPQRAAPPQPARPQPSVAPRQAEPPRPVEPPRPAPQPSVEPRVQHPAPPVRAPEPPRQQAPENRPTPTERPDRSERQERPERGGRG